MGRARKKEDQWMPPRVYRGKSAYEWRPKNGGCIKLCPLDSARSVVWQRYEFEVAALAKVEGTIANLVKEFMASPQWEELAPRTRKDYAGYWGVLEPVFGRTPSNKLRPEHIREYLDLRGTKSKVQANREKAFLSKVFSWGYERGKVPLNPCIGVRAHKEKFRERYIEDWEYAYVYEAASLPVKIAMEISYLCAARQGDVLSLQRSQLKPEGIFIRQGKTGKKQIKAWTPRLRAAIAMAKTLPGVDSIYLIHTKTGGKYTKDGFYSAWRTALLAGEKAAREKHQDANFDFTFHDLKAKGISDFTGDKKTFSGHKTDAMVAVYDRKVQVVETLDKALETPKK